MSFPTENALPACKYPLRGELIVFSAVQSFCNLLYLVSFGNSVDINEIVAIIFRATITGKMHYNIFNWVGPIVWYV